MGTGKYKDLDETKLVIEATGAEMVTVAIRRMNIGQDKNKLSLLDFISPEKYTILPNSYSARECSNYLKSWRHD